MTTAIDHRYPIGKFVAGEGSRTEHIETLRLLPERLADAVSELEDAQLDIPYREGGWTVRQLVHHVADSHANCYVRMKLALTEDWPVIKPYDEAAWAELPDSRLLVDVSLELIRALHTRWVALLEGMSEEDFQKGFVHPGIKENGGRQTLVQVVALYDWHSRHHTAHITQLRQRMGW